MPSTKIERKLVVIYDEDQAIFASKANNLFVLGWECLSSGCGYFISGKDKDEVAHRLWWMILVRKDRVLIQ